jgi:hypothetical protein
MDSGMSTTSTSTTRRKKAQIATLDIQVRALSEQGLGCRAIGEELGENPVFIYKRLRAMGINRSSDETYEALHSVLQVPLPFTAPDSANQLRAAALGEAISWFLRRGYVPSIPVEPTRYDLVVESDQGLKRVQVKSTAYQERGRFVAGIGRMEYDGTMETLNASGRRTRARYSPDDVDFFFIVTSSGDKYLVPIEVAGVAKSLTLDRKYAAYKVE